MTIKAMVEDFLEKTPKFRERKHKDAGIVHLLIKVKRNGGMPLDSGALVQFVRDYASADRAWRQALEHRKELRGSDYSDKTMLESQKRIDLGYAK